MTEYRIGDPVQVGDRTAMFLHWEEDRFARNGLRLAVIVDRTALMRVPVYEDKIRPVV